MRFETKHKGLAVLKEVWFFSLNTPHSKCKNNFPTSLCQFIFYSHYVVYMYLQTYCKANMFRILTCLVRHEARGCMD